MTDPLNIFFDDFSIIMLTRPKTLFQPWIYLPSLPYTVCNL